VNCASCGSNNQAECPTEMSIHIRRNPGQPGILLFPKVLICVDCGFSQFTVPENELRELVYSKFVDQVRVQYAGSLSHP